MLKPTYTPIYYPPITRRPSHHPSNRPTKLQTNFPTNITTNVNTTIAILSTPNNNKLSQSNIIVIVSCSVFFSLCIMVIIYIIYDKRDKKRRELQFQKWMTQEANIRIYRPSI